MNRNIELGTNEHVIDSCRLFGGIAAETRAKLASSSVRNAYASGETIFMQGSPCPGIFIVHSGLVRVVRGGTRGQQHVLHLCGPGQSFAEVAVFGNFDLPASAIAAQATECLVIPADVIQREISSNHELCRQLLSGMAMWTRHFVQMLDDLVLRDATERVARVLCDAPSDQSGAAILPGPKKDLANHLNLTSETFSRVLRRFIDDGVLETDAARAIRILQPDRLKQLSEREFRRQR